MFPKVSLWSLIFFEPSVYIRRIHVCSPQDYTLPTLTLQHAVCLLTPFQLKKPSLLAPR
uniref:Uncharacterized protein n=1 Tax=Parascaris equorum TaxID=6256 RepID=A0A914RDT1_PAREQ